MAIIKVSNSHSNLKNVINYVTKKEKTTVKLVSGLHCSPESAYMEMQTTKELHSKTGGRTYKHIIQSFPPDEKITPEQAHTIAMEFASTCPLFNGYEILVATHLDRGHLHSHFILNSVSFQTGRKFQMSKQDLQSMKDLSDSICRKYNLSICEKGKTMPGEERKGLTSNEMGKYQFLQRASERKIKSYVQDCAVAVYDSMSESTSKEEFISSMNQKGYSVDWSDRKYIVFTNAQGKKVRNRNLEKTYGMQVSKEDLTRLFNEKARKKESPSRHRKI